MGSVCGSNKKKKHGPLSFLVFGAKGSGKSSALNMISMGEEIGADRNKYNLDKKETYKGTYVKSFNYQGKPIKTYEVVENNRDNVLSCIKSLHCSGLIYVASANDFEEMKRCKDLLDEVVNHYQMNTYVCPILVLFAKRDIEQLPISTMEVELKVEEVAKHKHLIKKEIRNDKPGQMIEAFDQLLQLIESHQPNN